MGSIISAINDHLDEMEDSINNCLIIKQAISDGVGHCGTDKGKCIGYVDHGGEPDSDCLKCEFYVGYDG